MEHQFAATAAVLFFCTMFLSFYVSDMRSGARKVILKMCAWMTGLTTFSCAMLAIWL